MRTLCFILFALSAQAPTRGAVVRDSNWALLLQEIPPTGVPATFNGTFKMAEHGQIVVDAGDGETMRMYVTHSTKFFRDGKPAKLSQFENGDSVTVDAERDVRMNLIAVRVEKVKPPSANTKDKPK